MHPQHRFAVALVGIFTCLAAPVVAAGPSRPDPILAGTPSGPCDPAPDGAAYVGGTDILGNPVAPADADDHSSDALAAAADAHIVVEPRDRHHRNTVGRVYVELPGAENLLTQSANCAPQR
ncbi:MAG: hypothetical protein JSR60_09990 [Proteobacteria bacterium]|nr:hypothetical protein [Pseudomonadota bacterium]